MFEEEKQVVQRIRQRFPVEAERTDQWQIDRGWEMTELEEAPHLWVEAFADRTTEAARAGEWSAVTQHTEFMAAEYRNGAEPVKKLVDTAYAENLLWNLQEPVKVLAWPHVSSVIRELYEHMWGAPGSGRTL